ncbi:apolipoprotein N-acyltransferase [Shewanella surugensis]|uniref:Apolipoprotein N-acyltransferase n=1 Tax=Shewanella surugensis TaxID=212020 RepID=A0ABT0LG97_9GAMM|nr:apolipoprotein N-acyltransferase [Shewanella surugensis]MCL1126510.1 apolipoprotein N-acyltransferase [Shewanella surugensis]
MANFRAKIRPPLSRLMWLQSLLLAMLFAGLLSLALLDHGRFYWVWFAFIPMLYAIEKTSLAVTYLLGVIAGLLIFASATYWVADFLVIAKGQTAVTRFLWASLYWLYCAQLFGLLFWFFQLLKRHIRVHEFILFPLVVASLTAAYPQLFSLTFAETQVQFLLALQGVSILGISGLDAIIALANIVVFKMLYLFTAKPSSISKTDKRAMLVAVSVIALWFGFGVQQRQEWTQIVARSDMMKVGIVQANESPDLGHVVAMAGYGKVYPPEMDMTARLGSIGAELVIWSEARPKGYLDDGQVQRAYQQEVANIGTSLLFQDLHNIVSPINGIVERRFNTAVMLNSEGEYVGGYQKIKRIPFGEYIPFVDEGSLVHAWLRSYFGGFSSELTAGKNMAVFSHAKADIVPLICYETTFSTFVANVIASASAIDIVINRPLKTQGNDKPLLLVAMSNDAWFGSRHQSNQHILTSALRAVENRTPLVHVVNNGPSILVSATGQILFSSDFRQAGGYVVEVPLLNHGRGSFFSRNPSLFHNILLILWGGILLVVIRRHWQQYQAVSKNHQELSVIRDISPSF